MAHTNSQQQSAVQTASLLVCAAILFIPSLMAGGREGAAGITIALLLLAYTFLCRRESFSMPSLPLFILGAFFSWIILNTIFFSRTPYHSIHMLLVSAAGVLFYLTSFHRHRKDIIAFIMVACSVVLTFIGFISFIQSQNYGYLRFISTFYNHNVFGGFLILPFVLSLWFFWKEKEYGHILSFFAVSFFSAALILTFSRGTYLSVLAAGAGACIVFFRATPHKKIVLKKILVCCIALVLGAILAYGTFAIKKVQSNHDDTDVSTPYAGEQTDENGISARIEYLKHALMLFREKPLTGYGLGSFAQEARRIQTDVRYYSTDPHSMYVQMFAELGLVGGFLFLIFVVYHIVKGGLYIRAHPDDTLYGIFFAGFMGIVFHIAIEPDFQFPSFVLLFFLLAAIMVDTRTDRKKHNSLAWKYATMGLAIGILIFESCIYLGMRSFAKAEAYAAVHNRDGFMTSYHHASFFDPLNPFMRKKAAEIMLGFGDTNIAQEQIRASLDIHLFDQSAHMMQARLFLAQGSTSQAQAEYTTSLTLAPFRDIDPAIGIITILLKEGKYREASHVFTALQQRFPASAFSSSLWIDPRKDDMRQRIEDTKNTLDGVLKKSHDARETF